MKTVRLPAIKVPTLRTFREIGLTLGCLGFLTASAWTINLTCGLAAAGISLGILEYLLRPEPANGTR